MYEGVEGTVVSDCPHNPSNGRMTDRIRSRSRGMFNKRRMSQSKIRNPSFIRR